MSIELGSNEMLLNKDKTYLIIKPFCGFCENFALSKPELAQLIAALQAMHDKMGDSTC